MEIEQTRALTSLGLFGNAGGYLGMFLGGAIIQIPQAFEKFYNILINLNNRHVQTL